MFDINEIYQFQLKNKKFLGDSPDFLQNVLNELGSINRWYDNFTFDNSCSTYGRSPSPKKMHAIGLPITLTNVSILDIGAYEGFYSYQCEGRGASVTSQDNFIWHAQGENSKERFLFMYDLLESKNKIQDVPLMELKGSYDVVLFMGVLYHLENQLETLRKVRSLTKGLCVIETLLDNIHLQGSILTSYMDGNLNNDPTNTYSHNLASLTEMIRKAGFRNLEFKSIWEVNTIGQLEGRDPFKESLTSARIVIWAYP